eukprot:Sdes_comp19862_c1_seq2m12125
MDILIALTALFILTISALSPYIFYTLYSDVNQVALDSTKIQFESFRFLSPGESSSKVFVGVFYQNVGNLNVQFLKNRVEMYRNSNLFAYLTMERIKLNRRTSQFFNQTMTMEVIDPLSFREFSNNLIAGEAASVSLKSNGFQANYYFLNSIKILSSLKLSKVVPISGGFPMQMSMTLQNLTNVQSDKLTFQAYINVTNPSSFSLEGLSDLYFNVLSSTSSIGRLYIPYFNTTSPQSRMENCKVVFSSSNFGNQLLNDVVSAWASGQSQNVILKGPLASSAGFLDDSLQIVVRLVGRNTLGLPEYGAVSFNSILSGQVLGSNLVAEINNPFQMYNVTMSAPAAALMTIYPVAFMIRSSQ